MARGIHKCVASLQFITAILSFVSHTWQLHKYLENARKSNGGLPGVFKKKIAPRHGEVAPLYSSLQVGQTHNAQHLQMLSTRLLQPVPIDNSCYRSGWVATASWIITAGLTLITLQRRPRRHDSRDDGLIRCGRAQQSWNPPERRLPPQVCPRQEKLHHKTG